MGESLPLNLSPKVATDKLVGTARILGITGTDCDATTDRIEGGTHTLRYPRLEFSPPVNKFTAQENS